MIEQEPSRDKAGRFRKGSTGNPKGRTPAHARTERLRAMLESDADAIVQKVIEAAKGGDLAAAKLVIERILPALRPVRPAVQFDLDTRTPTDAALAVLQAASEGQLSSDIAVDLIGALSGTVRLLELRDIEQRIGALESA